MKKTVLIVGALALVGVGAYMFLQNKKKEEAILGGGSGTAQAELPQQELLLVLQQLLQVELLQVVQVLRMMVV